MKRFVLSCCLLLTLGSMFGIATVGATEKQPNIIFLLTDDQNLLSVGCYGNPEVQTPNMDQLGRDGVIFHKHYDTTAICMASRSNVFTGMYEYKTGTNFTHGDMKPEVWNKSYPMLLRDAGYLTGFAGKFGIEVDGKGLCEEDFDFWGGGPGQTNYATKSNKSMAKYAKEYPHSSLSYGAFGRDVIRESVKKDKPFCLSISYKAPHRPVSPDPKFDHIYAGKKFTKPANYGRQFGEHLAPQSKLGRQFPRFKEWDYDDDYDAVMAKYFQQVYAVDVSIGMVRDEVKAQGIEDNTIIIFTSDNGFICGSHGYGSKVLPMEESSRVPLIIYDPRIPAQNKADHRRKLTGNIDMMPTILSIAGLPVPENVDGVNLLPLLKKGPIQEWRKQLALMNCYGPHIGVHCLTCVTEDWKYTYWWYKNKNMEPVEELFHLSEDPNEFANEASNPIHATSLDEMRRRYDVELKAWQQEAVPYNNYQRYGTLFDREAAWSDKEKVLQRGRKSRRGKKSSSP